VYGEPGVLSSMYRPYSGWNVGATMLGPRVSVLNEWNLSEQAHESSVSASILRVLEASLRSISVWQSESTASFCAACSSTIMYSILDSAALRQTVYTG
jgi:hypothetical protein